MLFYLIPPKCVNIILSSFDADPLSRDAPAGRVSEERPGSPIPATTD